MPVCLPLASFVRDFQANIRSTLTLILLLACLLVSNVYAAATLTGKVVDAADCTTPVHPVSIDLMDPATGISLY